MLVYVGETSPECLLRPGKPLNMAARLSDDLVESAEANLIKLMLEQSQMENEHGQAHRMDVG